MAMAYAQTQPAKPDLFSVSPASVITIAPPAIARMAYPFKGFAPEHESPSRTVQYDNSTVDKLLRVWKELGINPVDGTSLTLLPVERLKFSVNKAELLDAWASITAVIHDAVRDIACSPDDLVAFLIAISDFESEKGFAEKAGILVSALINGGPGQEYTVPTAHLGIELNYLGSLNRKRVIVDGSAGSYAGFLMQGGSLSVRENVGYRVGRAMMHGRISVDGSAGDEVGSFLLGGDILVHGNSGKFVGFSMGGGTITVMGNASELAGVGMENGILRINGNVGMSAGNSMRGGRMMICGNAGDQAGLSLEGGEIVIEGSASGYVGFDMKGGILRIKRDAGYSVGYEMSGGEIHIYGKCKSIGNIVSGGKIFVGGIQLFPRLEVV